MGLSTGFGVSQKSEAGGGMPAPPFDPTSAHNGTSIDAAGKVVLGNDGGLYPGPGAFENTREIDMNSHDFLIGRSNKTAAGNVIITAVTTEITGPVQEDSAYDFFLVDQEFNIGGSPVLMRLAVTKSFASNNACFMKMNEAVAGIDIHTFKLNGDFAFGNNGAGGIIQSDSGILWIRPDGITRYGLFNGGDAEIKLGDLEGTFSSARLNIFLATGRMTFTDGFGNEYLSASSQGGALGNVTDATQPKLVVNGSSNAISGYVGDSETFRVDNGAGAGLEAFLGDVNSVANSTLLIIDDRTGNQRVTITAANGLVVNATNGYFAQTGGTLTNGAAAAAGTLNNAPVAGNPTKWIKIRDAGVDRFIPAW
jgi:hypothetical protein